MEINFPQYSLVRDEKSNSPLPLSCLELSDKMIPGGFLHEAFRSDSERQWSLMPLFLYIFLGQDVSFPDESVVVLFELPKVGVYHSSSPNFPAQMQLFGLKKSYTRSAQPFL